jgi:prepilin-type processing-associated H-X9-DG protein
MKNRRCNGRITAFETIFDGESMYPEYLPDLDVLVCPSAISMGGDSVESYDKGNVISDNFVETPGFTNSGHVEPCEILDHPYVYISWAFTNEMFEMASQIENFYQSVRDFGSAMYSDALIVYEDWEYSVPLDDSGRHDGAYRLREGIERFFITDINNPGASAEAQSSIVIMLDNIADAAESFNHVPGGANLLFLDGHVRFERYPFERSGGGVVLEDAPLPIGGQFPMNGAGIVLHIANHIFAPGEEGIESGFHQDVAWPGTDYE